ncbi:gliding motility-associated C-terminal domain-containing protein [Flavobacterium dauae]|uniref:T9SS type B sorting domain-containing protein n=1 Tax=Flavobacterium dauae TaxID=1563479 RepID=UPI00101B3B27|nr:gliding motility-associated C-terminal domain-containing protein [Flavobacterium dauae]WLD23592.1 gliding motility-associated C-terminal domain-containing protein [Flavobacterium dauae]
MLKKILFFLLFANMSVYAQKIAPDYECFDINISEIGVDTEFVRDQNDPDLYIVCEGIPVNVVPNFQTQYLRRTDVYEVEPIDFDANSFPLTGGTEINPGASWDDGRTDCPIKLPFKFSFFNQTYEYINVWSNGAVIFTTDTETECSPWVRTSFIDEVFSGPIPGSVVNNQFLNAIFGTYQHTHWDKNTYPNGSINYQVYGEAPCRKFVISFEGLPAAGLSGLCAPPVPFQSHQIVLHELTNVIDINIFQHDDCPATQPEEARTVVGIVNADDTNAYSAPGRNYAIFNATKESWRFGPAGECMYKTEWTVTGDSGTYTETDLCEGSLYLDIIDEVKEVTASLVVNTTIDEGTPGDPGAEYVETYKIRIKQAIEIDQVDDIQPIVCDKNQNTYDLNLITQEIKDRQSASEEEIKKLRFHYYETEDDALNRVNEIKDVREYPIKEIENPLYVRIEYLDIAECFEIIEVMIIKAPVEVMPKTDVYICEEYTLPVLTNDEFYYKMERLDEDAKYVVETIPEIKANQVINKHGYYRVYVKKTNKYGCEDVKTYLLMVENCSYPKGISPNADGENDYLDLTYNNVYELKVYNRYGKLVYEAGKGYKREWAGQDSSGKQLPSGTYFLYVKTKNNEYQDWIQLMYEVK